MELFTRILIFLTMAGFALGAGKELPKNFMKCPQSDPKVDKCFAVAITDALRKIKSGIPEFGVLPLDPLAVDSLIISEGSDSPVNIRQEFKNVKIYHISDANILRASVDLKKQRIRVSAIIPRLEMISDYVMDGRVLVLPITGKGKSNITIVGLAGEHSMSMESFKQEDEHYWRAKEFKIKYKPKRVYMHFENLFNGDKALSDVMHKFLDENWETVFNEVIGGYEKAFGLIFKEIVNQIFTKVPSKNVFED